MEITVSYWTVVTSILLTNVISAPISRKKTCSELSEDVLSGILGPAFNSRYMSVTEPQELDFNLADQGSLKRASALEPSFYVDDMYSYELSDTPAWKTNHFTDKRDGHHLSRDKRALKSQNRQWECQSRIKWHDLGPNYFPRYLRSVECTSSTCWFDMLHCRPRSFTVKILRKKNRCVSDSGFRVGNTGLPKDLRELWVWEERAVNFCCDCAL